MNLLLLVDELRDRNLIQTFLRKPLKKRYETLPAIEQETTPTQPFNCEEQVTPQMALLKQVTSKIPSTSASGFAVLRKMLRLYVIESDFCYKKNNVEVILKALTMIFSII